MLTLNKTKKIIIACTMLISCILAFSNRAKAEVVDQTSVFYVNDYANILSVEVKNYIISSNLDLNNKTGAQIVVVTVPSLNGQTIEEYATELFRKFGIGDKDKNNGVLLLCSTGDRKFRIEVGYGLEGRLTDGKTGRIQDEYIIPYLKNDDWDAGIKNGFSAVLQEVSNEYGITINGAEEVSQTTSTNNKNEDKFSVILYLSIFATIIMGIVKKGFHPFKFIYVAIITAVSFIILKDWVYTLTIGLINSVFLIFGYGSLDGFSGGGYSGGGGGFSGGRRFIRRRRLFKQFLKYNYARDKM